MQADFREASTGEATYFHVPIQVLGSETFVGLTHKPWPALYKGMLITTVSAPRYPHSAGAARAHLMAKASFQAKFFASLKAHVHPWPLARFHQSPALTTKGAVAVTRIARQEDAATAIAFRLSGVHPEVREPTY